MLHARLGGQLVVSLDLTDIVLGKKLVAALHFSYACTQRTGCLARLGHNGHQKMRDAVVLRQLNDLRVYEDELDILRAGAEQEADDDRVDTDGFTAAGRACNQQVRHFAQVSDLRRAGNILAKRHREGAAHIDIILGFKDRADVDRGADLIGNLDADCGFAGNGGLDAHARRGKIQCNIIGKAGDAADLDARLGLQLIPGDRGAAADVEHRGLDAEAVQRIYQNIGVFLHLAGGTGLVIGAGRVEEIQRWIAVGLRRLLHGGRQAHGVRVSLGRAGRCMDRRTS